MPVETLSLKTLRKKASKLGWSVRHHRNYNRRAGNDGYVVINAPRNYPVTEPLDEIELRGWLVDRITTEDWAS